MSDYGDYSGGYDQGDYSSGGGYDEPSDRRRSSAERGLSRGTSDTGVVGGGVVKPVGATPIKPYGAALPKSIVGLHIMGVILDIIFCIVIIVLAGILLSYLDPFWVHGPGTGECSNPTTSPCQEDEYKRESIAFLVVCGVLIVEVFTMLVCGCTLRASSNYGLVHAHNSFSLSMWIVIFSIGAYLIYVLIQEDSCDIRCTVGKEKVYNFAKSTSAVGIAFGTFMVLIRFIMSICFCVSGRRRR